MLQPGHDVLIDDGLVRLRVEAVAGEYCARCAVVVGGTVSSHKGVNVPGVRCAIPALTEKDTDDLEFALGLGADFVALSFVRSAADVRDLKELIEAGALDAHVIAKIEKARGDRRARPRSWRAATRSWSPAATWASRSASRRCRSSRSGIIREARSRAESP